MRLVLDKLVEEPKSWSPKEKIVCPVCKRTLIEIRKDMLARARECVRDQGPKVIVYGCHRPNCLNEFCPWNIRWMRMRNHVQ
jgi:4-hydroxy-3-methylbut-2-en-1-yl diphosphate synthase IspG/GcpE